MTHKDQRQENRRQFLRRAGHSVGLAGLLLLAGNLVFRRFRSGRNETCINEGICRGCAIFDDCGLPQALSAKQSRAEQQ